MRRSILGLGAFAALAGPAAAAPANTLDGLFAQLEQCLQTSLPGSGTDVTIMFMLNRKGALIGKPRLTHAIWPKDANPRDAAAAVASDFDHCLPAAITDALGGAIAGRLISYRLRTEPKQEKV